MSDPAVRRPIPHGRFRRMDRRRCGISSATNFPPRRTRSGQGLCRPRDGRQFRRIFPSRLFHPHSSARFRLFFSCGHFVVGSALFRPPRGRPHGRLFAGHFADGRHPPPPLSLPILLLFRRLHPPSRGRQQYDPDVRGRDAGRRWKYAGQETAVPFRRQRLRRRRRFALRRFPQSLQLIGPVVRLFRRREILQQHPPDEDVYGGRDQGMRSSSAGDEQLRQPDGRRARLRLHRPLRPQQEIGFYARRSSPAPSVSTPSDGQLKQSRNFGLEATTLKFVSCGAFLFILFLVACCPLLLNVFT